MGILKPCAPPAVTAAFRRDLRSYLGWEDTDSERRPFEKYVGRPPQIPTPTDIGDSVDREVAYDAMPVYVIGLKDTTRKQGPITAVQSGWRVFAGNDRGKVVMGRVSLKKGETWKLTGVNYGDRVWAWIEERRQLAGIEATQREDYDVRVLTIPGLAVEVFWLKSQSGGEDLVVPLRWPDTSKSSPEPVTMAHFLAHLRPCARQTARAL